MPGPLLGHSFFKILVKKTHGCGAALLSDLPSRIGWVFLEEFGPYFLFIHGIFDNMSSLRCIIITPCVILAYQYCIASSSLTHTGGENKYGRPITDQEVIISITTLILNYYD